MSMPAPIPTPGETLPQELQPLSAQLATPEHVAAHARNTVKNVLDSYTGRFDVLAESIQNAIDALDKRWSTVDSFETEHPRLTVELDASADEISITDNGIGIDQQDMLSALVPHMSPKSLDPSPTRGHKGVGTTFLAYGHQHFQIHTKIQASAEVAYRLDGGLAWVRGSKLTAPPNFMRIDSPAALDDMSSGTRVVVGVGEDTRFGRLKTAQYNKLATWSLVLRTFTAVGNLAIGVPAHKTPEWIKQLTVELKLTGVAAAGTCIVPVGFHLPHHGAATKVSLQTLSAGSVPANNRYELLYAEYDNPALEIILAPQLQELADSDQPEDQEILNAFRAYDTSVYASWAYKNTWYEDLFRGRIGEEAKRYQYNNVRSGLLVTSVGMPIGEVNDHPYVTMKPEYKRRMFVAVGFNENYSPDLGRKTIPSVDRALLRWLELQLQNLFLKHVSRLIKSNEESTHSAGSFDEAKEQLQAHTEDLRKKHARRISLGTQLGIDRAPNFESELVAIFAALLATGRLQGYEILAIPGSATRYDGLFDFRTSDFHSSTDSDPAPPGISSSRATGGVFKRTGKWLEFKLRLEDLVEDFAVAEGDPSKKYFDLCDLAVVWAVPLSDAIGDFDLEKYDSNTWQERNYFGATHRLLRSHGSHRIDVIAIQDFLAQAQ